MVLQKCQGTTCNRGEFGLWPCKKSPECILSSIFFPEDAPSTSRPRNKRFGQELSLFANHLGRQNGDTLEEFHGSPGWRMVKKKFLTDLGGSSSWLGWLFIYNYNIYIYIIYIYISQHVHTYQQKHLMFHPPHLENFPWSSEFSFRSHVQSRWFTTDPWDFWSGAFRNLEKTSSTTQLGLGREWFSRCRIFFGWEILTLKPGESNLMQFGW